MCPMKKPEFTGETLPTVGMATWKGGEKKTLTFLDNGVDWTGEFGLAYVYTVMEGEEKKRIYIRPSSPMDIGLSRLLVDHETMEGLTVEIEKTTGKAQKDTRYNAEAVDIQPPEPKEEETVKKVQDRRKR